MAWSSKYHKCPQSGSFLKHYVVSILGIQAPSNDCNALGWRLNEASISEIISASSRSSALPQIRCLNQDKSSSQCCWGQRSQEDAARVKNCTSRVLFVKVLMCWLHCRGSWFYRLPPEALQSTPSAPWRRVVLWWCKLLSCYSRFQRRSLCQATCFLFLIMLLVVGWSPEIQPHNGEGPSLGLLIICLSSFFISSQVMILPFRGPSLRHHFYHHFPLYCC